ncbi:MAG: C45 family autoproteolytic acyltransferase/hydrolase [Candidatus Thorarchaeota archaeon]
MNNYNLISKKFYHVVLEGTSYEIGQQIGDLLYKDNKLPIHLITSGVSDPQKLGFKEFKDIQIFMEEYCPGINDEMQGLADNLGVNVKKISYYDVILSGPPGMFGCTHFSVLGKATVDNHTLTGRSYEWDAEQEDFVLYTTRLKGKNKHIGFSGLTFGRAEGLNEYGLAVTMSNGGIFGKKLKNNKGFVFWLIIRALLENCKNIEDATKFIKNIPVLGFFNFIISDSGNILLIECADGIKGFKKIDKNSEEYYICATNSYTLPETVKFNKDNIEIRLNGAIWRRDFVEHALKRKYPKISMSTIRKILSKNIPQGVCAHWYLDGFGTNWSLIFDNTKPHVEICFGAPTHNEWRTFNFDDPPRIQEYNAILPDIQE